MPTELELIVRALKLIRGCIYHQLISKEEYNYKDLEELDEITVRLEGLNKE